MTNRRQKITAFDSRIVELSVEHKGKHNMLELISNELSSHDDFLEIAHDLRDNGALGLFIRKTISPNTAVGSTF